MRPKWLGIFVIGVSAMSASAFVTAGSNVTEHFGVEHLVAIAEQRQQQAGQGGSLVVAHLEARAIGGGHRARHVAGEPARQHVGHGGAEAWRQLLRQPEVEQADHRAREHEEVPRMRVALEEALLEDHAGVDAADAATHLAQVVAGGA